LVIDLFLVNLAATPASNRNIREVIATAWNEFAAMHDTGAETVDIVSVASRMTSSVEEIVADAIAANALSTDPETAQRRSEIVEDRIAFVDQLVTAAPAATAGYYQFEEQLRREVAARYGQIEPPNLLGRERIDIERLFVTPRLSYSHGPEEG